MYLVENTFLNEIRLNSSKLHDMAEHTGFIKRLIEGNANVTTYAEYIYNLYHIYNAIESNLEKNKGSEYIKDFALPEVYRAEAIMKDVKYLLKDKLDSMEPLISTKVFVNRINHIGEKNKELLIAHAYTRYLADLFGGRTIYQIVKENYKIDGKGLNYYIFHEINDLKNFVMDYHEKLNNIKFDETLKKDFINEISISYIYNISISNELEFDRFK